MRNEFNNFFYEFFLLIFCLPTNSLLTTQLLKYFVYFNRFLCYFGLTGLHITINIQRKYVTINVLFLLLLG